MIYYVMLLAALVIAASAAYVGNRLLLGALGRGAAVSLVPWWEEGCKMLAVVLLPAMPMLPLHLCFGLVESIYDIARSRQNGLFLGALSFTGHGLFGAVAALLATQTGSLWWAYLAAAISHTLYSFAVLYFVLPTLGSSVHVGTNKR